MRQKTDYQELTDDDIDLEEEGEHLVLELNKISIPSKPPRKPRSLSLPDPDISEYLTIVRSLSERLTLVEQTATFQAKRIKELERKLNDEGNEYIPKLNSDSFVFNPDNIESTKFPSYVGNIARAEFHKIVKMYKDGDILSTLDAMTLLSYAMTVQKFHDFEAKFNDGTYEHTQHNFNTGMSSRTPESMIHQETVRNMTALGSQLGVNPTSRKRMDLKAKGGGKQMSALEAFVASRKNN